MHKKFEEVQKIDSIWPLSIMAVTLVGNWLLYFLLKHDDLTFFYISVLSVGLLSLFISSLKLSTEISNESVRYKMFPFHFKWKELSRKEIVKMEVRTYKPLQEYGGWGNRRGKSGRAYTIKGKRGLQLTLKNGDKILLGTSKADEMVKFI
ncbi:MAG: hypothetical protein IPN86_15790 [Saprospiraceae bacterium]|nr:hypothetical protein [Saprospiraceae bacterium]